MDKRRIDSGDTLSATLAGDLRSIVGRLKRRLREQGTVGDFTPSQVAVLLRLERDGPATVSSLARAEGMRPQSMGTTIAPLEAAGLLAGSPDPDDGRQTLLSLTETCRTYLRKNRAAREDWLCRTIQARLTADEQRHLATAVKLLERLAAD
ncbi:MarR family winged helix-turn-helix transcriptional regulator [Trinickia acidisoli]|uniref:MarR family winged helix-turn-helix transcriptional regulator n=1 Tax=Trinickia acidisoli TaxID=2767482 RepID=UPI001A8DF987|nr:MarR family transcriptional regulator [Trinickia acidisoli]